MKNIKYITLAASLCLTMSACGDYLDVETPANTDDNFVTSTVLETWKALSWAYADYTQNVAGGGNYNWNDPCSDVEYYPEYNSNNGRIGYLRSQECGVNDRSSQYTGLFRELARAKRVADIIKGKSEYQSAKAAGTVNDWTQLHGEAMTFYSWCYFELVRHFGDVPFGIENTVVNANEGYTLTSRYDILDNIIAILKDVEGEMYDLGQGGITAERMSRTFANMLIGEAALNAAGFQTQRTDVDGLYGDLTFNVKYEDSKLKAKYAQRTDCQKYYQEAQTYLRRTLNERKGSMQLLTSDSRSYADNPFQMGLQYIHNMEVSPESLFESGNRPSSGSERPYSQGRPSNGGGKNGAPCKVFGGVRIMPTFFYTGFEDGDKRADASMVVTGSDGKGTEQLIHFNSGSRLNGGISTNKWDENRVTPTPYTTAQRNTGLNYQMRRASNVILLLAEADAALGESTECLSLLNQLRSRAGVAALSGISGTEALQAAVSEEVKRELVGEGDVRWNMVRTGTFTERAKQVRQDIKDMIAGLEANGYYTFPNGRTISNYVWTKLVKAPATGMLTYDRVEGDPAQVPGWRGVFDYSTIASVASLVVGDKHNLAIKGLYEYIAPNSSEAAALEADGWTMENWAVDIIAGKDQLWDYNILSGITLTDVPLYYHSLPATTISQSAGKVTNGYGLPQQ